MLKILPVVMSAGCDVETTLKVQVGNAGLCPDRDLVDPACLTVSQVLGLQVLHMTPNESLVLHLGS